MNLDQLADLAATAGPWVALAAALVVAAVLIGWAARKVKAESRTVQNVLTAAAGLIATGVQADSMWRFFEHQMGVAELWKRVAFFAFVEVCLLVSALRARRHRIDHGRAGFDDLMVWGFALLGGILAAADADGWAAFLRFLAPIIAAGMFERAISAERADVTGEDRNRWLARLAVRLGFSDPDERDLTDIARARRVSRLATRAYRYATGIRPLRRWRARRYRAALAAANDRIGFATDPALVEADRVNLATLHFALDATTRDAVADVNPWRLPPVDELADDDELDQADEGDGAAQVDLDAHGPGNGKVSVSRRPASETRKAYDRLTRRRPGLTQKEYAGLLQMSERALRAALAKTEAGNRA